MSGKSDEAGQPAPDPTQAEETHTESGAPTDKAHEEDGDGTLSGSVPAGLNADELHEVANSDKTDDTGTS